MILEPQPVKKISSANATDPVLLRAREGLVHADVPRALHAYHHLIQRGRLLEEVLPDLARMVKSHPHDPEVWETLGDALARAGRLEHAHQSYEQARKLRQ